MQTLGGAPLGSETLAGQRPDIIFLAYTFKNGSDWEVRWRSTSDFITWGSENTMSIAWDSIDSTDELRNPYLIQIGGSGELWLLLEAVADIIDGQEISNIYYTVSQDYGLSWGTTIKVTNYDSVVAAAQHPTAVQKTKSQMHIIFDEFRNALTFDSTKSGWCESPLSIQMGDSYWDATADRWYVTITNNGGGNKRLHGVIEVELDSWTITDCWGFSSVPAFHNWAATNHIWYNHAKNARPYVVIGHLSLVTNEGLHFQVLNYVDNTITSYDFEDWASQDITANVTWTNHEPSRAKYSLGYFTIDAINKRLYVAYRDFGTVGNVSIGYIDLTDPGPQYTYNEVIYDTTLDFATRGQMDLSGSGGIQILPEADLVIITKQADGLGVWTDLPMRVYSLSGGGLTKIYRRSTFPTHPDGGVYRDFLFKIVGGQRVLYCPFEYRTTFGQSSFRGIYKFNLDTETGSYLRPTTSTEDEYGIQNISDLDNDNIVMTSNINGIYIMNVNTEAWTVINNANTPGLTGDGIDRIGRQVSYDPLRGIILSGTYQVFGGWLGLLAVSQFGPLRKSKFLLGNVGSPWSFPSAGSNFVQGINDYNAVAVVDPVSSGIYAFWVNDTLTELSIKWDFEQGNVNLDPHIVRDSDIAMERFIDGSPSRLSFIVSDGHLFDPHNINSVLSTVLKKGRQITLRFGELSAGTSFWKNQGTYLVVETSMEYERGNYPIMNVSCEDKLSTWDDHEVIATDSYFGVDPDVALDDIVQSFTDFTSSTINLPTMNNKEEINYQWLEMTVLDIVLQLTNRFGYYPRIDMDGKFNIKEISENNSISQTYTDASPIVNFSPDDTFSDFTNKVVVSGEEIDFIEVIHTEERIGILEGTIGWWGGKEIHKLYYSEDKQRTARNPRMNVLKTMTSMGFKVAEVFGGSISEGIEGEDPDEHWVETFMEVPNLVPMLIAALGVAAGGIWVGNWNIHPTGGGPPTRSIPVGRAIFGGGVMIALNILGSVASYQHEIWASPIGKIRRSIQAIANDTVAQADLGYEVEKKLDDPLCNTVLGCQFVADFELMVSRLQRSRVRFTKITNMLYEDGDTIQIIHPHTGQSLRIFITQLRRRMSVAGESNNGYFFDDIEGWVV